MTKISMKEYDELVTKYNSLVKPFSDFKDILSKVADKEKEQDKNKKEFTTIGHDRNSQTITFDLEEIPEITNGDKYVAWRIYVDLATRITTQPLSGNANIKEALDSIYLVFTSTRHTLATCGPDINASSVLAIPMLNQTIRPFLTKWHNNKPGSVEQVEQFHKELYHLQKILDQFAAVFREMSNGKRCTLQVKPLQTS